MSNNGHLLASALCAVRFADFPQATVHKAKLHILDTLGVSLAGSASGETRMALDAFGLRNTAGRAGVWGTSFHIDARSAAFINGISAHAYELDDSGGCDHSGAVVLPAAIAALTECDATVSGEAFLRSILLGYEAGRRVLEAAGGYEEHNGPGWHSTGTCGTFGATAAAGALMGFDASQMASALGTACSFSAGTWAFIGNGSPAKKLHSGRAAEGGVMAAFLTRAGFAGPDTVFEEDAWGSFFSTFCRGNTDIAALTAGFGEKWRLDRCSFKPYATCRGTHSAIDAVDLILARNGLDVSSIAALEVDISAFQHGMCGSSRVETRAQAQMSLPYALAARLQYGKVFLAELEQDAWSAPAIRHWLERTIVRTDLSMKDEDEPAITIVTTDGARYREVVEQPLGSPLNPLSDAQVFAKYTDLASAVLPAQRVEAILDLVMGMERQSDMRALTELL